MDEYYDSDEWGDIVFEETTRNYDTRTSPQRVKGGLLVMAGILDLALMGALFFMMYMTDILGSIPDIGKQVIVIILLACGLVTLIGGLGILGRRQKRTVLMENGIVRGRFTHFDNTPVIEVRGPKEKVAVLRRKGSKPMYTDLSKIKKAKGYAFVIEAPEEYDFTEFVDNLQRLGYGGEKEEKGEGEEGTDGKDGKDGKDAKDAKDGGDEAAADPKDDGGGDGKKD